MAPSAKGGPTLRPLCKNAFQSDEAAAHVRKAQQGLRRKEGSAHHAAQRRLEKRRDSRP